MTEYEDLVSAYEVDVRFPDVSGMEHLDMLLTRSRIAKVEAALTPEQQQRVQAADQELMFHADRFYTAIRRIADLAAWREREKATPAEWWWYLDVLAHAPKAKSEQPESVAA
jgi:hypothetical protein